MTTITITLIDPSKWLTSEREIATARGRDWRRAALNAAKRAGLEVKGVALSRPVGEGVYEVQFSEGFVPGANAVSLSRRYIVRCA